MSDPRHIYRPKKLTSIAQKRYSRKYNSEYLEEKAAHGASIKIGFGDFDGDGDLDGLYPKHRAAVAEKPGLHINASRRGPSMLIANTLPALGPTNLKSPTPEAGPLSLEFQADPPLFGPTGLGALVKTSSIGPSSLNASVVAPAAGPQSLEASEVIEGTSAIVHRFTYEMGEDLDYYRVGVHDLELNSGELQVAGTTEFGKSPYPKTYTNEYKDNQIYSASWVSLSGDGSTYAEKTFRFASGTTSNVVNIYKKAGDSWQLQSSITIAESPYGVWLNQDGTAFIVTGDFNTWSDGASITCFRRYEFIDGVWTIVGPATGRSMFGQRQGTEEAYHISYDLKYITYVFYYTFSGRNYLPSEERFMGVVVFEWDEENQIYEIYNDSHETLGNNWANNIVQFYGSYSNHFYESFYDAVNDQLRIVYRAPDNLDILISTYTADTKTFDTSWGDREAKIWGNETALAERTGYNSANHTQVIANTHYAGASMTRDGNHMVVASKAEGYKLLEWNPGIMEYDVLASLAYDDRWSSSYQKGRGLQIIDKDNFVVLGAASSSYPAGELHHYRVNGSNELEYAGTVPLGNSFSLSYDWTTIA